MSIEMIESLAKFFGKDIALRAYALSLLQTSKLGIALEDAVKKTVYSLKIIATAMIGRHAKRLVVDHSCSYAESSRHSVRYALPYGKAMDELESRHEGSRAYTYGNASRDSDIIKNNAVEKMAIAETEKNGFEEKIHAKMWVESYLNKLSTKKYNWLLESVELLTKNGYLSKKDSMQITRETRKQSIKIEPNQFIELIARYAI